VTLRAPSSLPAVRGGFSVATWAALGILVLGVLLRCAYLDSDPYYDEWAGYITDEGRWVENARSLALRGTLFEEPWNLHFLMAPLFQLGTYVAFVVGGVSFLTSRLLTALSGSAMLVLFWVLLIQPQRRRQQQQKRLLAELTVGDEVITVGGLYGRVLEVGDNDVTLEVAPGTNVRVAKSAVAARTMQDAGETEPEPTEPR